VAEQKLDEAKDRISKLRERVQAVDAQRRSMERD
jgi:hypothetical protein